MVENNPDQNEKYQEYLNTLQQQMDREQLDTIQKDGLLSNNDGGMIREQLDFSEQLGELYHLLKGEQRVENNDGSTSWIVTNNTKDIRILSDLGVEFVMNFLRSYLNKNTILSNYKEDTINEKMADLSNSINDALFMSYEKYFLQPTREECYVMVKENIKNLLQDRKFQAELLSKEFDEDKIREEIIKNMNLEREFSKIREIYRKEKLKGYESLHRQIQDTINSAYNRAWNGQERRSLRQSMHVSENRNPNFSKQNSNPIKRLFGG